MDRSTTIRRRHPTADGWLMDRSGVESGNFTSCDSPTGPSDASPTSRGATRPCGRTGNRPSRTSIVVARDNERTGGFPTILLGAGRPCGRMSSAASAQESGGDLVPGRIPEPVLRVIEAGPGLVLVIEPVVGHRQEEAVVEDLPAIQAGGPLEGFDRLARVAGAVLGGPVGPGDPGVRRRSRRPCTLRIASAGSRNSATGQLTRNQIR